MFLQALLGVLLLLDAILGRFQLHFDPLLLRHAAELEMAALAVTEEVGRDRSLVDRVDCDWSLQAVCIAIRHVVRGEDFVLAVRERRDGQDQPLLVGVLVLLDAALDVQRLQVVLELLK
jgi:hypothetical protein